MSYKPSLYLQISAYPTHEYVSVNNNIFSRFLTIFIYVRIKIPGIGCVNPIHRLPSPESILMF